MLTESYYGVPVSPSSSTTVTNAVVQIANQKSLLVSDDFASWTQSRPPVPWKNGGPNPKSPLFLRRLRGTGSLYGTAFIYRCLLIFLTNLTSAICLESVLCSQEIRDLKCLHVFHKECLDKWYLQDQFHCPLCHRAYYQQHIQPTNEFVWMV